MKYKKRTDGRYQASINVGKDDNGKAIRKVVYGRTIAELEDKIIEVKSDIKNNTFVKTAETLLKDYAPLWLKTYKSKKSINTIAMYTNIIDKHIVPALGDLQLNQITRSDIQKAITDRADQYRTCEQFRMCIKQILDSAIDDKLLLSNPCIKITLPDKPRNNKRALTDQEKLAIKKADFTDREKAFVYLIYFFGIRREEALALMANDFDFENNTLTINKALVFNKNEPIISKTKNKSSDRVLPVPTSVLEFFKIYCKGKLYLITKLDNTLITQSAYVKMWTSIVKKMNDALITDEQIKIGYKPICGLTAHIFRHNYATMLYYSDVSLKKAAQLMGHNNTKMIMEVYAHLDDEKENIVDKINTVINL